MPPVAVPAASAPVLERSSELAVLEDGLRAAREGSGRLVLIEGPAGIGKSRLVAAVRAAAASAGMPVLSARCSEFERSFAFGAVRQAFEPHLRALDDKQRDEAFGGAAALARSLLAGTPGEDEGGADLFARLHGLHWLLANLGGDAPLLLTVDDAHWADEASLRFLGFVARRVAELPVLVVVGTRPLDEPTADPAVAPLLTDPDAVVLRPGPLSPEAVGALVGQRSGRPADAEFVAACVHATGGNPFLVRELAAEIEEQDLAPGAAGADLVPSLGPAGVARAINLRVERLGPACVALAGALAILGDGADLRTVGSFAGLGDPAAVDAQRQLEAADVVAVVESRLRFVHPIVREAIYRGLTATDRAERHGAAAELLAARAAPPEAVAAHLIHAPPHGSAATVEVLRAAAAEAEALGDPKAAAAYLARARIEPPAPEHAAQVRFEYGRAAAHAGDPRAIRALEESITADSPAAVVRDATLLLADLRTFSGRPDLAVDALERGIRILGDFTEAGLQLTASLVPAAHISVPIRARLQERMRSFVDTGGPPHDATEFAALAALASDAIMDRNEGTRAAELGLRALQAPLPAPLDLATRGTCFVLAVCLMGAEEYLASERVLERLLDEADTLGAPALTVTVMCLRGLVRYRRGLVAAAESDALTALELLPDAHGAEMMAHAGTGAAVLAGIELERPRTALERLLDETGYARDPDILPYTMILLARGALLEEHGDFEAALAAFGTCNRDAPGWGGNTPALVPWRSGAVSCLLALGRGAEAAALAEEDLRLARASGLPRCTGVAEHGLAMTAVGAERVAGLESAVARLEGAAAPLSAARALVDLAAEQRTRGERSAARDAAARAHEHCERTGATRLAGRARAELRALGGRPKATPGLGVFALTPAERRVADLAAAGRTNRQIAESLFVSEKTVETHMARVFRKLDVSSRRQLPAAMA